MSPPDLDVLIIGTGFAGTYLLHRLLGLNYRVRALDAGPSLGGIWNHNTYPGARVDIQVPSYQLDIPSLWDGDAGFKWTQRFPAREEIQAYFAFAERRLGGLGRHCEFGTWVEGVRWDEKEGIWVVRARDGRCWRARFVVCAVGYAAKAYVPEIEGLEGFKGVWAHTAAWPEGGIMTRGKRVGVVGTGASGVQVVQAVARECKSLVVFQRSPALATPMQQREFD
ncbi:FAD/NAD(P)-binding domain-containing protein, partial [Patellaria atrata CBS 101060]